MKVNQARPSIAVSARFTGPAALFLPAGTPSLSSLLLLTAVVLLVLCLPSCVRQQEPAEPPRILGVDSMPSAETIRGHWDLLSVWRRKGYRNEIAVHIGGTDGLAPLSAEQMKTVEQALQKQRADLSGSQHITHENYLFAAARLGIVKKAIWVMPFNYLDFSNAEERVKFYLKEHAAHLRTGDVESLKFDRGCVSGTLNGVDTSICSLLTVSGFDGPALLVIDTDFVPLYAERKVLPGLLAMRDMFVHLISKRLSVRFPRVVPSPGLKATQGYLAEHVLAVLKDPSIISEKSEPPKLWSARERADYLLSAGLHREALSFLDSVEKEFADDPYLVLMKESARSFISKEQSP